MKKICLAALLLWAGVGCVPSDRALKESFRNPPVEYRPMPFLHLNGSLTREGIAKHLSDAKTRCHFGGVAPLPVSPGPHFHDGSLCPGLSPAYLSDECFQRYTDLLTLSREQGTQVVLYDDIDFPSGSAGGRLQREFPEYTRKYMQVDETLVRGGSVFCKTYRGEQIDHLMALSALDTLSRRVVDLAPFLRDSLLRWEAPEGVWRVMMFTCQRATEGVHSYLVDYMQPAAAEKVLEMTYAQYDKRFGEYFGNVITKTFYDDVGFVHQENTWTPAITDIFRQQYGKNPALYYPALYYDIGPETAAARVAFFDIRSELMAEGYVRQVAEWSAARRLRSMGHPPENYSPNSVVAHGDILKYYRHTQIPLLDAIFYYGRGLHGFKQISSAADLGDKPTVGAELCGAFPDEMDSLTLYRVVMESMARGVNFVVPHGMWYDADSAHIRIPPLISADNPRLRDALPAYGDYVGRCCMMLDGGARVSEVAMLWPIEAVQGATTIGRDAASGLPVANWLPEGVSHYRLSDLLTNVLRRDFTYIHPENLTDGRVIAEGPELVLDNRENRQRYKLLVIPGGDVISAAALQAVKRYYDGGGKVLAVSSLPTRSSEFGRDEEVRQILRTIFPGQEASAGVSADRVRTNEKGGVFAFASDASAGKIERMMDTMGVLPDVAFDPGEIPSHQVGYLNYIHKRKAGKDFYFFTNTTECPLDITVRLRELLKSPEIWNPHTGTMEKALRVAVRRNGEYASTEIALSLPPVSSLFVVGER